MIYRYLGIYLGDFPRVGPKRIIGDLSLETKSPTVEEDGAILSRLLLAVVSISLGDNARVRSSPHFAPSQRHSVRAGL